ncbi:hypothetical protein C5O80_26375 [Burkholderia sp. SRS-46]|nr:hypothetical protein C5O80_26375 [Burkholderia sp. SRS-46]
MERQAGRQPRRRQPPQRRPARRPPPQQFRVVTARGRPRRPSVDRPTTCNRRTRAGFFSPRPPFHDTKNFFVS